jgi:hypothetical protein
LTAPRGTNARSIFLYLTEMSEIEHALVHRVHANEDAINFNSYQNFKIENIQKFENFVW